MGQWKPLHITRLLLEGMQPLSWVVLLILVVSRTLGKAKRSMTRTVLDIWMQTVERTASIDKAVTVGL